MLYYARVDDSEGIDDIDEASKSKDCDICHYWYLQIKGLTFNQMPAMGVMMTCL